MQYIFLLLTHAFTISKYADYINVNLFHAFTRLYINFLNHVKITLNNVEFTFMKNMLLRYRKQQKDKKKEEGRYNKMNNEIMKTLEENAGKETAKAIKAMTDRGETIAKQGTYGMNSKDNTALASLCDESSSNALEAIHLSYLMGLSRAWDISIRNRDKSTESIGYIVSSLMTSIRMRQSAIDAMSMIDDEKELFTFSKLAYRFLEVEYDQNQDFMRELEKVANMLDEEKRYSE